MNPQTPFSRRRFLSTAALPLVLPFGGSARAEPGGAIRFGVISDVHQDVMHDGVGRVAAFVKAMTEAGADFIVQLGDFCVPKEANQPFLEAWNRFAGPRHHLLGNHDMDGGFTREKAAAFLGMPGLYYGFDHAGARFLALDGNDPGGTARGYKRFIGPAQLDWLARELAATDKPVVVMIHQPLESAGGVENQEAVRAVLEKGRREGRPGVVACLSGHLHRDYVRRLNGILHAQINSASYVWLSENAAREVYDPALHKAHPYLRMVAPYRDPLWALVTLDLAAGTLRIAGRATEWVGPDPWARGVAEKDYPRAEVRPAVSDWSGPLR